MKDVDIKKYCDLMEEIKRRTKVIDFFWKQDGHALYKTTTIESVALQIRKILELIAMSSLIANKRKYETVYKDFAKAWNAEYLLRDLSRINPDYYPKAVVEEPCEEEGIKTHQKDMEDGFLTKQDFVKVYKKCGAILHSENPYGRKISYHFYEKSIPKWREQIIKLLNCHTIRLVGEENFYLIHMKEDQDDRVHYYEFAPVKDR